MCYSHPFIVLHWWRTDCHNLFLSRMLFIRITKAFVFKIFWPWFINKEYWTCKLLNSFLGIVFSQFIYVFPLQPCMRSTQIQLVYSTSLWSYRVLSGFGMTWRSTFTNPTAALITGVAIFISIIHNTDKFFWCLPHPIDDTCWLSNMILKNLFINIRFKCASYLQYAMIGTMKDINKGSPRFRYVWCEETKWIS